MDNQIVIYQTDNGQTAIDVRLENKTVWLTQAQMALLFQKDRAVIGRHIRNVFTEGELDEKVVCANCTHHSTWRNFAPVGANVGQDAPKPAFVEK